jgi:hypothetical protein
MTTRSIVIAVALLATSAALVAQNGTSAAVNVPQLVASSLAATERQWLERSHYTYMTRVESRRRDMEGHLKSQDVEISETTLVDDVPFEQLIEHNGQPPSAREERRQTRARDALKHETPAQRTERLHEDNAEAASLLEELPKAFDFHVVGQDVVRGRTAYVLHVTPHAGYEARGTYGKVFSKVEGTLWIDTQNLVWIKVDGQVIEPFSIGVFLVRLLRGSQVRVEQTRIDDGTWLPAHIEVRAAATILLVKSVVIERELTYTGYRRAVVDAAATRDTAIP